ncbi:hypothetical protein, partial [Xanthomonas sp. D-109]|uniref:hypothetical protein n=1 Tax=Xanthomonas sp. D-109 TaxID=2821274 RepID=UPI001ADCDCB3
MTATSPSDGVAAPPALAAFLRGIERRAADLHRAQGRHHPPDGRQGRGDPRDEGRRRAGRAPRGRP